MKKIPQLKIGIRNESKDVAVIDIDGEIGWASYDGEELTWNTKEAIKKQLNEISKLDVSKIVVNISSLGGFVDDGLAIHDVLASHKAHIETKVTGMTASAATIIAQAGDTRSMSDNALYLIHKAWGFAMGNSNDMRASLEDLETIDKRIVNIYQKRSGADLDEIQALMDENNGDGKWIDAEEAKALGLIDEVFEPMKAAASVDRATFQNMGLPESDKIKFKEADSPNTFNVDEFMRGVIEFQNNLKKENVSNDTAKEIPEGISLEQAREREIEILIEE